MRALAIVHQPDAGPGVFAETFGERGVQLDEWEIGRESTPPADPRDYDAVLTFGGAMDAHQEEDHPWLRFEKDLLAGLLDREIPLLAVCLGTQLLADSVWATPRRSRRPEIGWFEVEVTDEGAEDPLIGPLAPGFIAFQWHSYETPLPSGATALARSPICLQAYRIGEIAWGIQFHAEVSAADVDLWIDDWQNDPSAVAMGLDPEALRAESHKRIEAWNELGRELCGRFIDAAALAKRPAASA